MERKLSINIDAELLEWLKNYQYTLQVVTGEVVSLSEIIDTTIKQFKGKVILKIQERPNYIVERETSRGRKISKSHKERNKQIK